MDWKTIQKAREKLDSEKGTVIKDWGGRNSIALVYPNSYFLGMSSLGFQTLYGILNQYDDIACERVFCEGSEFISIESQRPLGDFDVLAFSVSYELDYFNIARVLKNSGIPVFAQDREDHHPLVIAGGAAVTANPEPLALIIDCFAIGEAEAILPQMVSVLLDGLELPRDELLTKLAEVPGIYVPSIADDTAVRQYAPELGDFNIGSVVLTNDTELGDMYLMEIARGCARGCRFCLAGYHFGPMRYRPVKNLLEQAAKGLEYRKRMGLVSAAISDYPQIEELVDGLRSMDAEFSVSSIRIKPLPEVILQGLAESGAKTVTLAPEAGSERLRRIISKGISADDILKALHKVAKYDFRQVKLYFMIGLPTENDRDIVEISELALKAKAILDEYRAGTQLTLNVTPFVPKAGTPFQWLPMERGEVLKDRMILLKNSLRRRGIEVKSDSIEWSLVQGSLARGDSSFGQVITNMSRVSLAAWQKACTKSKVEASYIHHELPRDARLPWARVDSGTKTEQLLKELQKAV